MCTEQIRLCENYLPRMQRLHCIVNNYYSNKSDKYISLYSVVWNCMSRVKSQNLTWTSNPLLCAIKCFFNGINVINRYKCMSIEYIVEITKLTILRMSHLVYQERKLAVESWKRSVTGSGARRGDSVLKGRSDKIIIKHDVIDAPQPLPRTPLASAAYFHLTNNSSIIITYLFNYGYTQLYTHLKFLF